MEILDYDELYKIQDKVMELVFSFNNEFYLTGGTCLSRFYFPKRYSDDLDFFSNNYNYFAYDIKKIKNILSKNFALSVLVESKDFVRLIIDNTLQVDFVNDRVPRYKEPNYLSNGFVIDNVENILSNKITAVLGRDDPKDIFDIYLIWKNHTFDWSDILNSAQEKMSFTLEDLVARLKGFPENLLSKIKLIDKDFLANFSSDFQIIISEIAVTE
jgi:predicted nucleotidyltransferase component of viral defense system